jgi:hypothetical protein
MAGFMAYVLVCCLLSIPIFMRIAKAMRPMIASSDGQEVLGWTLNAVSGRVLDSRSTSTAITTGTVQGYSSSGQVIGGFSTRVERNDSFLLQDASGQQHSYSLKDFDADVYVGQVITMCYAHRGGKSVPVVVINHSTRRQFFNDKELFRLASGRSIGIALYAVFTCLFTVLASGFWALMINRQLRGFRRTGVNPLVARANLAAEPLMARP